MVAGVEVNKKRNEPFVLSCFNLLLILELPHVFFSVQSVLNSLIQKAFYC